MSELVASVGTLCRMCSSQGLISISSIILPEMLKIESDVMWKIPIKDILAAISGEEVSEDDGLPQFICTCCHYYLQHAYEVRLKIRESSFSMRTALELAQQEGKNFSTAQNIATNLPKNPELDVTHQEIESDEEDAEMEESYQESKCVPCNARFMGEESYNKHKDSCVISNLDYLYFVLGNLTKMRNANQIDREEFVLRAIAALLLAKEKIDLFYEKKGLSDVVLCNNPAIFDEAAAERNQDYHDKKQKRIANKFNLNNNHKITNQTINMHFASNQTLLNEGFNNKRKTNRKFPETYVDTPAKQ